MKRTLSILAMLCIIVSLFVSCANLSKASIDTYTIVYEKLDGGRTKNCARELQNYLRSVTGTKMEFLDQEEAGEGYEYEILIGQTGRPESIAASEGFLTPMDYSIRITKNKVVIVGYTPYATAAATEKYIELIKEDPKLLKSSKFSYDYHFDTSYLNPLCYDASSFKPLWSVFYSAPEWMVDDYYETLYAIMDKDGRQTAFAHRGDFVYYPQSSLEGVISACMAGADIIELDFRLTKDNVPILMHDEDLRKNTNCASKMGRNGLPNSYWVGDWTYEELMQLNMVKNDGSMTKCKVSTVYEALLVAKQFGASLTWDDKADETLHPVFAATSATTFEDMYTLMNGTDTLHYFFYYYAYYSRMNTLSYWENLENLGKKASEALPFFLACLEKTMTENYAVPGVWGFWDDDRYKAWGYDKQSENDRYWDIWYEEGKTQIWTNCIAACCQHISETYEPEDYSNILK